MFSHKRGLTCDDRVKASPSSGCCANREVKVGIDSSVPDQVLKMPPCDPRDPSVIPHDAVPYMKLPPATKSMTVELTYRDGSVSEIKSFRR
jgi:hypothetical protein